jgi:hypothetical protein
MKFFAVALLLQIISLSENCGPVVRIPIVINTWGFTNATVQAWDVVERQEKSAVSLSVQLILIAIEVRCDKIMFIDRSMLLSKAVLCVNENNVMEPLVMEARRMRTAKQL